MSDYIERQAAIDTVAFGITIASAFNKDTGVRIDLFANENAELTKAINRIQDLPSADVVQVVHGKWIDEDPAFAEYFANCSVCGYEIDVHNERGYFNFCPNCGAKMRGEQE